MAAEDVEHDVEVEVNRPGLVPAAVTVWVMSARIDVLARRHSDLLRPAAGLDVADGADAGVDY